jgi:hypothetical protein
MSLKDFFKRWSKAENDRAIERAVEDSRGTAYERDLEQEDFEARKQDLRVGSSFAGSAAEDAAGDDLP